MIAQFLTYCARGLIGLFSVAVLFVLLYRFAPVPGTTLMALRSLQGQEIQYDWRGLDQISPHLIDAVVAAEDMKFCRHIGFDFGEIKAAYNDYKKGKPLRGASTISQQTAKNAFLWPGRGPIRKLAEAGFTVPMELLYPKRRIMEIYLNVAEWGDGLFGAEAAAQARFGKSAADLSRREAALLASVLPAPNSWRVDPPGPYVRGRSRTVLARMNSVGERNLAACVKR
ncbi:MAG: monofunctional biosynthetic peptidoglycan transglycosylase [Pseudomonadota bacterium]